MVLSLGLVGRRPAGTGPAAVRAAAPDRTPPDTLLFMNMTGRIVQLSRGEWAGAAEISGGGPPVTRASL